MMPFRMGPWEIGLVLLIILIVFGVGKLPQVGGAIGKGLHAFKKGQEEDEEDVEARPQTARRPRAKAASKATTIKS